MGRKFTFDDDKKKNQGLHAVWYGIGFLILVVLTIGGYWAADQLLEINRQTPFLPFPVIERWQWQPIKFLPPIPGSLIVKLTATVLLDLLAFSVLVVIYTLVAPDPRRKDPYYVPPIRSKGKMRQSR